ncbi:DUF481 domain-containing protein [Flavihumibacter rivuli]|uniref:DUF481 domain-containing protein n=1 Tax=Flavihumibacter rivuli TaxID=2838156 RepID=UPI001BDF5A08|nr:DUF481 domain-containing protein [Flavihumibacter rivuli]ULQ58104.1 DUF481 domain-containing protein [Flavihumibacter rivuli]
MKYGSSKYQKIPFAGAIATLFALLLLTIKLSGQEKKDTLYFHNGTILIGKLKKIKLGYITFKPDNISEVTIQIPKVKTIAANTKIFRVELTNNQSYFGILKTAPFPNTSSMIRTQDTVTVFLEDISVLYPYGKSFKSRFSGSATIGYSYTKSSEFGRANFETKLNYITKRDEVSLSASGIYTITDSSFNRDREDASLKYNYYLNTNWFLTTFLTYQRNLELGLNRRFQEGFGIGDKFLTTKSIYAWSRGGFVLNQEKNIEGESSKTLTEVFGQLQFNFFRFTKPKIKVNLSQAFFYSLSQNGRFRNDGETNIDYEIITDFKINLGFYNNFDSKSPDTGTSKFDFGIVFGLSYIF